MSCVQAAVLCDCKFIDTFRPFKKKILKDENKHYGAVDESSSEQQFRKSYTITFVVSKICSHTPSVSGSYGRQSDRQSDKILVDLEIFKILY